MILGRLYDLALWPHPWPWCWSGNFKVKVWNSFIAGMGCRLTWNEKDVSHPFMTMILTSVVMVGWADVPDSDWGDFRRRRAVDISSSIMLLTNTDPENREINPVSKGMEFHGNLMKICSPRFPNITNKCRYRKQTNQSWIQVFKCSIMIIYQIVACLMAHFCWKFLENPLTLFSVMLLTDTNSPEKWEK